MAWKNGYVRSSLLNKVLSTPTQGKALSFKVWSRASTIVPEFLGYRVRIHNGKDFFPLLITQEMVGYKFGEFVGTRARYQFKKKKKRK